MRASLLSSASSGWKPSFLGALCLSGPRECTGRVTSDPQELSGDHKQMASLMHLYTSSVDSSPATGFESNFCLPPIPAAKSCSHTSQNRTFGVEIPQRTFRSRSSLGFDTVVALATVFIQPQILKSHDGRFYKPGTCNLYTFCICSGIPHLS